MTQLPALPSPDLDAEIAALVRAHRRASGPVMALVNRLGQGMERQMAALPPRARAEVDRVTKRALEAAFEAGAKLPDLGPRGGLAAVAMTGAMGGAGGWVTSLPEIPATVALILSAIRAEARAAGFDPDAEGVKAACLAVFADASPLERDDGANSGFLAARMTLTGAALNGLIARAVPRLGLALSQKLAAQAVPVLGAVTGAALNTAYLRFYREMARIRFALMRLSVQHGAETVVTAFRAEDRRGKPVLAGK